MAALALTPAAAGAAAGTLDPSFDGDGKRFLPQTLLANEVLVQEDGKILVVGVGGPTQDVDFVATRLNADGSLDRGFGGDGVAVADFGNDERANAAALQPDGRIVVAGQRRSATAGQQPAVARFDPGRHDQPHARLVL